MATLKNTVIDDTAALQLPVGTTAQRPVSPSNGMMRFNSELKRVEQWNGFFWKYLPDISRRNLIVNLDAAEPTSYSGSGDTWFNIGSLGGSVSKGTFMPIFATISGVKCLRFNQVGSYLQNDTFFSSPVPNDSTNLTIDVWVYLESTNLTSGDRNNICRGTAPNAWYMSITKDTLQQSNYWYGKSPEGYFEGGVLQRNVWHNMVAVWTSTEINQYLNGVKTTSSTIGTSASRSNGIQIGWEADGRQFHGAISNIKIYDIPLSDYQVAANFNATRAGFGI
jgi:hypothetical protein